MAFDSKGYFSYIRVSTLRQGQTGTSLAEQRESIHRYASRWSLKIAREFEEKETAAKSGRPVFLKMLNALKRGNANGVIIHKIDRGARNLHDWAELGDIIDSGIEVHFANENLDLDSRGGRLSADIQAVVAADYIRNLREEVRKGFYGRIKQGLYPMPAPTGYIDKGSARPKELHPVQAPLVRKTFQLYATGNWGINALVEKMFASGLRNKKGGRITRNGMSKLLHNHFYAGFIKIKNNDELFLGQHRPIVPRHIFEQVQAVIRDRNIKGPLRHDFIFRRLLTCARCQLTLIGELQKGCVYYRCHNRDCPQTSIREDTVEAQILPFLKNLKFTAIENQYLEQQIEKHYLDAKEDREARLRSLTLDLAHSKTRASNLTDAYLDGVVDREAFTEKKNSLLLDQQTLEDRIANIDRDTRATAETVRQILELANDAYLSYKSANAVEKRELVKTISSNIRVEGKTLLTKLKLPFQTITEREHAQYGRPHRATARTLSRLLSQLFSYAKSIKDKEEEVEVAKPVEITTRRLKLAFRRFNSSGEEKLAA